MSDDYWLKQKSFTDWKLHQSALLKLLADQDTAELQKVNTAIKLVKKLHAEPRLDGVGMASVHLLRVSRILIEEMRENKTDVILTALLHDVLEDTSYGEKPILAVFGEPVLRGVKILSRPREQDWAEYVRDVVAQEDISIIKIKIADRLDNARSLSMSKNQKLRDYDLFKTTGIMMPIIYEYYPFIWSKFEEVLSRWGNTK